MDILLRIRLTLKSFQTFKLSNINIKTKVEDLKLKVADLGLPEDSLEFIYCGCILEDDATLESSGLKNGAMVHVLLKKNLDKPVPAKYISESNILQLANVFRSFNENPALRSALHRLSRRSEVIENIILTTPGLNDDSVAIAMLQDPDLMAHFTDPDTVKRIAELHPVLVEAAQLVATAVHEEAHSTAAASGPGPSLINVPSTAYSYSLDNLSDDEEMAGGDSSQSSDSAQPIVSSGFSSNSSTITTAQLAAALSRASARSTITSSNSLSSTSAASSNSGVITTEMFSQAMQQAFASAPNSTNRLPPIPPILPQPSDLQNQLAQMHEIGLHDDAVNVQALQFTNGDVQAAIELVFSGFSDT